MFLNDTSEYVNEKVNELLEQWVLVRQLVYMIAKKNIESRFVHLRFVSL